MNCISLTKISLNEIEYVCEHAFEGCIHLSKLNSRLILQLSFYKMPEN